MRFQVSRTSNWRGDRQPCEGAEAQSVSGARRSRWVIDVDSLEDLLRLAEREQQELVITPVSTLNKDFPLIEIYDDWRE